MANIEFERLMRSFLYGNISDECAAGFTLDDASVPPELGPWFVRLENQPKDKSLSSIVKEYIRQNVTLKRFMVVKDGRTYDVSIKKSDFLGKVSSALAGAKSRARGIKIAKRLLVCLSQLDKILVDGQVTRTVPTEEGSTKHIGSEWIYVRDFIKEPGLKGSVVIEIEFPAPERSAKNNLYHVTAKGAVGFTHRTNVINQNLDATGQIKIKLE